MEYFNLHKELKNLFLGEIDNDKFFFSFYRAGGQWLEDSLFERDGPGTFSEAKTKESLTNITDRRQNFSSNLHYFTPLSQSEQFSEYYDQSLMSNSRPFFSEENNSTRRRKIEEDFNRNLAAAREQMDIFPPVVSLTGVGRIRLSKFTPLDFFKNNQVWRNSPSLNVKLSTANQNITTISFEYVKVEVEFPWCEDESFLKNKNWFVPDMYSNQANIDGLFAIPRSFIVIRNLKISGEWSPETIENIPVIDSHSPFSVKSNSSPITENSLQIIGWIFEKLPALPPHSDPAQINNPISLVQKASTGYWYLAVLPPPNFMGPFNPIPWTPQIIWQPYGQVGFDYNVQLEDGNIYNALRTWPVPVPYGMIRGLIGPIKINSGGVFLADFGFIGNQTHIPNPGIHIEIYIVMFENGAVKSKEVIYKEDKYSDFNLLPISISLSRWVGKEFCIELNVFSGPFNGAMAYWVNPRIEFY
jgi:hypothetical protein